MDIFNQYIAQGNGWLFFPMAVVLGALHGLEPGHSKTMMTAFIVAIRGSVGQAFVLGISATIAHTAIIWILAFIGLYFSSAVQVKTFEPYFQLATGFIVIGMACIMLYRTYQAHQRAHRHEQANETIGSKDDSGCCHTHEGAQSVKTGKPMAAGEMTTWQIIVFGLTGGLLPCPSALAVLLVCLQLKKTSLGVAMVFGFSVGLGATLVAVGTLAALSVKHVSTRFKNFGDFAQRVPYASSTILLVIGFIVVIQGLSHLRSG